MPFQDGNQDAAKPIEEIKELAKLYCEHLSKGFSKKSFPDCDYRTIEERIKKEPHVLQSEKKELEKAERVGLKWWEAQGIENILNKKEMTKDQDGNTTLVETSLNAAVYIFNMKNRYKEDWRDKHEIETTPAELTVRITGPEPPPENN
jgi:hypothetical protein